MCGIIGYVGARDASPILISGLRRLEYRGYDSAGVAIVSGGRLHIVKDAGKIGQLAEQVSRSPLSGTTGIAHTRWATHGVPSRLNAHPHTDPDETVAVVHNGIIENFYTLKKRLAKDGAIFQTDTDTEVFAHLIARFYNNGTLEEAVQKTLREVTGAYGIAVVSTREPDKIVGARNGSPLVVGIGEGENFVASDVSAILEHTRQMIYLKDREMVVLRAGGTEITNLDNVHIERKPEKVLW
ncbi:MAG: glutamine--fructose-6-phosphate aminotransferase, partial [Candidatus Latescibacterota bacterium]